MIKYTLFVHTPYQPEVWSFHAYGSLENVSDILPYFLVYFDDILV